MKDPEISVIIPTFNNGPEIERAIKSVLNQDVFLTKGIKVEIVIVNDGSDAEKLDYLEQLANSYTEIILLHSDKQAGPAAARNFGIRNANAALIGFLDADDEWPADKIGTLLPFFDDKKVEIAGGKVKYTIEPGLPNLDIEFEDKDQRLTHVHLGALLIRKSVFEKGFYFDESLTYSEDMDWWLRLREHGARIVIAEKTTLIYHVHGKNMSVFKSPEQLQLLNILHKSLQRRKDKNVSDNVPQVKDFRVQRPDPLITVIVPLYNGKLFIKRAIDSILAQTYTNLEIYVIDDGSSDDGAEFVKENFPQLKVICQENSGVAKARNTGIKLSEGDLIAFIDQDDEWLPDKLEKQWLLLKENPYIAFVTCLQKFQFEDGASLPPFFKEELNLEHRAFVPSAVLIRKHALLTVGGFNETFKLGSDVDLIRILRNAGFKEGHVEKLLLNKWYHGKNESFDKKGGINDLLQILHKQLHEKK